MSGLDGLIEALVIFKKYGNPDCPTHCEHDELFICGIHPGDVSAVDVERLNELGFFIDADDHCFKSFRYGSA